MSLFDDRRSPPNRDPRGPVEAEDPIREALDNMRRLMKATRAAGDRFAPDLASALDNAHRLGEQVRKAHFDAADRQAAALANVEKGVNESVMFAERNGGAKIDRTAVLRDAAVRTANEAIASAGSEALGLASQAAQAGRALEEAIARANVKWRNGLGRAEQLDDLVSGERMRATLATKTTQEVFVFVAAMLSDPDLDERQWSTLDAVARALAVEALKQYRTADRARPRFDNAAGAAASVAERIIRALDAEVERRMPASVKLATEALESFRFVFRTLCAKNAQFMDRADYARFRDGGATSLAEVLSAWSVDDRWLSRFLRPKAWTCPGWSPIAFTDQLTGKPVRKPRA